MKLRSTLLSLAAIVLFLAPLAFADAGVDETFFGAGRTRLSLTGGYGSFDDHSYFVAGGGAGYYLLRGLEAGIDGEAWIGSKPHIYTVSPEMRYVYLGLQEFSPYIGGFVKRTFYDSLPDENSAGGRLGLATGLGPHTLVSAGVVYEKFLDCDRTLHSSCSQVYPEFGVSFSY